MSVSPSLAPAAGSRDRATIAMLLDHEVGAPPPASSASPSSSPPQQEQQQRQQAPQPQLSAPEASASAKPTKAIPSKIDEFELQPLIGDESEEKKAGPKLPALDTETHGRIETATFAVG